MTNLLVPDLEKSLFDLMTKDYPAPHCGNPGEVGGSRPRDECAPSSDEHEFKIGEEVVLSWGAEGKVVGYYLSGYYEIEHLTGFDKGKILTHPPMSVKRKGEEVPTVSWEYNEHEAFDLEKKATELFGTTDNPREAGFILSEGDLLDFSGKREGGPAGRRSYDHRDIGQANPDDAPGGTEGMMWFMVKTGAIRMGMYDTDFVIDLARPPTGYQDRKVRELMDWSENLVIDISDQDGATLWSSANEPMGRPESIWNIARRKADELLETRSFGLITLTFRDYPAPHNSFTGRSRHRRDNCMECSKKPLVACHWANGHGMAWFCMEHFKKWLDEDKRDIVGVWFLKDGEMPKDIRKTPSGTVKVRKLGEKISQKEIFSRLEELTERGNLGDSQPITREDLVGILRGDLILQGQLRRVVSLDDGPFLITADYPDPKHDKSEEIEISLPIQEQSEIEALQDDVGDETIRIDKTTDERKGLLNNVRQSLENLVEKVLDVVRVGGGLGQEDNASIEVNAAPIDTEPGRQQANFLENLPEDLQKVIKAGKFDKETTRRILENADKVIESANDEELRTSPLIQRLAQQTGAHIEGFDFRIKGRDSLARKIATDMIEKNISLEEATSDVYDAVRYTMVFDNGEFVDRVGGVQDRLVAEGWTQYDQKWRNYFPTGDGYDGYNTVMENPVTGERFELQFHTPETWKHKMDIHGLYAELRTLPRESPRRLEIWNQIVQAAKALPRPTDWDRLRGQQVVRE